MEEGVKRTRFVVGGVYFRAMPNGAKIFGLMSGGSLHGSGRRNGVLTSDGYAPVSVVEDTQELDEWKLISEPVATEVIERLERAVLVELPALRAELEELKSAGLPKAPDVDPLKDLKVTTGRARVSA